MLFYLLPVLSGALIAVMVAINGGLTDYYGLYSATVLIHIAGLIAVSLAMLVKRQRLLPAARKQRISPWLFVGGIIGVATTLFNNLSYGLISVSALLALGLLGQSVTSLAIDSFGLFGMKKIPFDRRKLLGLALVIGGILVIIFVK